MLKTTNPCPATGSGCPDAVNTVFALPCAPSEYDENIARLDIMCVVQPLSTMTGFSEVPGVAELATCRIPKTKCLSSPESVDWLTALARWWGHSDSSLCIFLHFLQILERTLSGAREGSLNQQVSTWCRPPQCEQPPVVLTATDGMPTGALWVTRTSASRDTACSKVIASRSNLSLIWRAAAGSDFSMAKARTAVRTDGSMVMRWRRISEASTDRRISE